MKEWGLVVVLTIFTPAVWAAGGVYKWVDEQGRVHYGERPPASSQSQEMQLKQQPTQGLSVDEPSREEQQQRLLRAFEEERAQKEEAKQKSKAEAAERERNCGRARDRLTRYQRSGFIYDIDQQGNRRILNDAEREATMREAEAAVRHWCD